MVDILGLQWNVEGGAEVGSGGVTGTVRRPAGRGEVGGGISGEGREERKNFKL